MDKYEKLEIIIDLIDNNDIVVASSVYIQLGGGKETGLDTFGDDWEIPDWDDILP